MYESLRTLVEDAETKDASQSLMFAALDLNFCVELCAEEVSSSGSGSGSSGSGSGGSGSGSSSSTREATLSKS